MISFPGLNLSLKINKIAFSIFGIDIAWYAIFIVLAIMIAFLLYKKREGLYEIRFQTILDLGLYVLPIAFLSARAYYVLFHLDYFLQNPVQILNLKRGGLAIYGGIIGGAVTCYYFAKKRNIVFLDLLDYVVPALALRTSHWKMGEFYQSRSLWYRNNYFFTNGNLGKWYIQRSTPYFFV